MMNGDYTIDIEVKDHTAHFAIRKNGRSFPLKLGVAKAGFGMGNEDFANEIGYRIQQKLVEFAKGEIHD